MRPIFRVATRQALNLKSVPRMITFCLGEFQIRNGVRIGVAAPRKGRSLSTQNTGPGVIRQPIVTHGARGDQLRQLTALESRKQARSTRSGECSHQTRQPFSCD